jgi:hypothetical protein
MAAAQIVEPDDEVVGVSAQNRAALLLRPEFRVHSGIGRSAN